MKSHNKILSFSEWTDQYISQIMMAAEKSRKPEIHLAKLDKIVSIKKKYEGTIDRYGEVVRVMNAFGVFLQKRDSKKLDHWRESVLEFMQEMQKNSLHVEVYEKTDEDGI